MSEIRAASDAFEDRVAVLDPEGERVDPHRALWSDFDIDADEVVAESATHAEAQLAYALASGKLREDGEGIEINLTDLFSLLMTAWQGGFTVGGLMYQRRRMGRR